jgi:hypothetical protein
MVNSTIRPSPIPSEPRATVEHPSSRGDTMRWKPLLFGLGVLDAAMGLSLVIWDTRLNPCFAERANRLRTGMTRAEVEAVMGSEGTEGFVFISGPPDYWARYWKENELFARKWEDAETTVEVQFAGPKGQATAGSFSHRSKNPAGHGSVSGTRIAIVLLVLSGFGLVVFGLCPRPAPRAGAPTPSSPPPA